MNWDSLFTFKVLGYVGDTGVWIGLTDKDGEGDWKWSSSK